VNSQEEALAGARDILAEWVNEDQSARRRFAASMLKRRCLHHRYCGKETEGAKYRDYFSWEEPVAKVHRTESWLFSGKKEGFLDLRLRPPDEEAAGVLEKMFVKGESAASQQVKEAVKDSYKRLLSLSMETEMRGETKERADREAIKVFAENLRELLLAAPLGRKNVMALILACARAARWRARPAGETP